MISFVVYSANVFQTFTFILQKSKLFKTCFTALVKNSRLENSFTLYIALHQLKTIQRSKFMTMSGGSVVLWF